MINEMMRECKWSVVVVVVDHFGVCCRRQHGMVRDETGNIPDFKFVLFCLCMDRRPMTMTVEGNGSISVVEGRTTPMMRPPSPTTTWNM
jgi:hypothetical protein